MLCCWCLSGKSQGSFWGISAPLSTGSLRKVLIDQSLEDTGNAQHLRKTRNKSNELQKKHMHITHAETERKMGHPGIHWVLAGFHLRPQIRVTVSSYTLSLERKNSMSSIKEEGKLSKVLSCQLPIYTNLFSPPKVSDDYGFWKIMDLFFFFSVHTQCTKKLFQKFKLEKQVICQYHRDNSRQLKTTLLESGTLQGELSTPCVCARLYPSPVRSSKV